MPGHSTVAARCAAIGSGIARIIKDTSSIARVLRNARYDINSTCADLMAIKVALDIAHDDFSSAPNYPELLLECASGLLDCCSLATDSLHKPIVRLSAVQDPAGSWQTLKAGDFTSLRNDLEAVRRALELLLDLVEILTLPSTTAFEISSPNRRSFFDDTDPEIWQTFLEKVDGERSHIDKITKGRLPELHTSFDKLRACVVYQLEECLSPQASPEKVIKKRPDRIVVPVPFSLPGSDKSLPPLPSPLSISSGIGAWIANVVNQAMHSPIPPSFKLKDPRLSFVGTISDRAPSRGTFYAESTTTTGTRPVSFTGPLPSYNLERVDSSQLAMKEPRMPRGKKPNNLYSIASTIISSDERSIIHQNLTSDKIAVAKGARRCLNRDQRSGLDFVLKNISTKTTPAEVEKILWEGADPNASDFQFGTLLIRAAHNFSTPVLRLLVEYGADITQTSHTVYYSTLHAAVLGNQLANLKWLVEMGIYFDAINQQGETPLHLAIKTPGGYPIAKWLLEMGADVNKESLDGTTPFMIAMRSSKVDSKERSMFVELLLAQGADGEIRRTNTMSRGKGLSVLGLR